VTTQIAWIVISDLLVDRMLEQRFEFVKVTSKEGCVMNDRSFKAVFGIHILECVQLMRTCDNQFFPFVFVEGFNVVLGHHFKETLLASQALRVSIIFFFLAKNGEINP